MATILLAEDDAAFAELIRQALCAKGHEVLRAESVGEAVRFFERRPFDLAILDVDLKDGSGFDICRYIRSHAARAKTPAIILSAAEDAHSKEAGFGAGADQYLVKSLPVEEFLLWVNALLRRASGVAPAEDIRRGPVCLEPETARVTVGGRDIRNLTLKEFSLLRALMVAAPKVVLRERLLKSIWGAVYETRTLDVHVNTLRRKLGPEGAIHIANVKGVGYFFE